MEVPRETDPITLRNILNGAAPETQNAVCHNPIEIRQLLFIFPLDHIDYKQPKAIQ